jgi:hypothetical protein
LIGGVDYYKDKLTDYHDTYGPIGKKSYSMTGYFIQDEWSFAPGWTLTPGIRLDEHSVYGNHTSPSVSLNYIANKSTNYYISYKDYFVAPNMYQLYSIWGNSNLKPEKGHTIEAGVKHQFDSTMNASFNVFKRDSEDILAWTYTGTTKNMYGSEYMNVDEEKARGASLTLSKSFLKHFTGTVGYTYTHIDAQDNANANRDGQLPKHAWNLGLNYAKERFSADLKARSIYGREFRKADTTRGNKQTSYWVSIGSELRAVQEHRSSPGSTTCSTSTTPNGRITPTRRSGIRSRAGISRPASSTPSDDGAEEDRLRRRHSRAQADLGPCLAGSNRRTGLGGTVGNGIRTAATCRRTDSDGACRGRGGRAHPARRA